MIVTLSALLLGVMQTEEPVRIEAAWIADHCEVRFGGKLLDADALDRVAKDWGRDNREVHIRASSDLPYRCIGSTIFVLQRGGVNRVGFISEVEDK